MLHLTVRVSTSNPTQAQQTALTALTPSTPKPLRLLFKRGPNLLSCLAHKRITCASRRRLLAICTMIRAPTIRSRLRGHILRASIPSAHATRRLQSPALMNPLQPALFHQTHINQKHRLVSHHQRTAMRMGRSVGAHMPQLRLHPVAVHMSLPMEHSHPR